MRGLKSKELSLKKVLKKVRPNLVALNEMLLTGNRKVTLSPYIWWSRNRKEKGGGGIATGVSQQFRDCSVGAGEGNDDN